MKSEKTVDIRPFTRELYRGNKILFVIYLFTTIIDVVLNLSVAWFMQQVFDLIAGVDIGFSLFELILIALAMLSITALSTFLSYVSKPKFKARGIEQYKNYVFTELSKKNISAFSRENTALYLSSLTNDISIIENGYLISIFGLANCILLFVASLIMMLFYSPLLTLIAILSSILPLVVSILTGNKVAKATENISSVNEEYTSSIRDALSGFTVIKSFKAEAEMIKLFASDTKRIASAQSRKEKLSILIESLANIAGFVAQFGVFIFAGYLAISGKGLTSGVVVMFTQMMNYLIYPIQAIPSHLAERKSAKALLTKIAAALKDNVREEKSETPLTLNKEIRVENLSFSYGDNKAALSNISCVFEHGKKYAIVGASGSGKSTLLNVLMSSYRNYDGSVKYDGTELRSINSSDLYDVQSIIQQNVFIFNSTIRDNITMFKRFDEADVQNAIELSGLSALIEEKGIDYLCGENGNKLSGGEKQRISIARSLLKRSQVLLVDEATASLDSETSAQISSSILAIEGITVIEIRHDLDASILQKYDSILTLKNGQLIENGTFDELIDKKGYFYSLFTVSQ